MDSKAMWGLAWQCREWHGLSVSLETSRNKQQLLKTEAGKLWQVSIFLARGSYILWAVISHHTKPEQQWLWNIHTWNPSAFPAEESHVLRRQRSVCSDRRWARRDGLVSCSLCLCVSKGSFRVFVNEGRRDTGGTFVRRELALVKLPASGCWWMASSGTQVRWELQKLKKTKGRRDMPGQGHFLGTNAYLG